MFMFVYANLSKDTIKGIAGSPNHEERFRVILSPDFAGEIAVGTEYIVNVARLFLQEFFDKGKACVLVFLSTY